MTTRRTGSGAVRTIGEELLARRRTNATHLILQRHEDIDRCPEVTERDRLRNILERTGKPGHIPLRIHPHFNHNSLIAEHRVRTQLHKFESGKSAADVDLPIVSEECVP